ncbi:MAG: HEAT repeat domain-containing protein [Bacteroidia bacterium]
MSRKNWTDEKLYNRLLTNKTKKTYWENIRELRKRPNPYVFKKAVELMKNGSEKEMNIGVDILAQLGARPRYRQNEIIEICFGLLEKKRSPQMLESILSAISHNNENLNQAQIQALTHFKNHNYQYVKFALVQTLAGLEQKKAIDTLIELSRDKNSEIRDWATFSLGTQIRTKSSEISHALWERINDKSELVRFEAIAGLAKRQDKNLKEVLIKELKNINHNGQIILESIEDYGDLDFIELLENKIEINNKTHTIDKALLIETLENLKKKK